MVMRLGEAGVETHGLLKASPRLVWLVLIATGQAQVIVGVGEAALELHGLP